MMKTSWKSIFYPHEAHIHALLDITMLYTIFWGFKKYRVSAQNTKVLAFDFTENVCSQQKLVENTYLIPVGPIFLLG
jgi:hypothetical protein